MAAPSRRKPDPCPECGEPTTLEGRFCKACGWDQDLDDSGDSHLDGVEVPQGYGPDGEGTARPMRPLWVVLALLALAGFVATFVFRG